MNDDLDQWVGQVQREITEKEKKVYSLKIMEECMNLTHRGTLRSPQASSSLRGPCGDMMEFFIMIPEDRLEKVRYLSDGCASSQACGNRLARWVEGMTISEAWKISPEMLDRELGGLPDNDNHCAALAVSSLRKAMGPPEKVQKNEAI